MSRHPFSGGRYPPPTIEVPSRTDPIEQGFSSFPFPAPAGGVDIEHTVYVAGDVANPGVLLMHELPGLSWQCVRLARLLVASGFRVYVPHLFGPKDHDGSAKAVSLANTARLCVSKEIKVFAARESSPITGWLRALGAKIRGECGGRGVGVVGMCLTGGFALSLLLDDVEVAPVLCQPSLPFWPSPSSSPGYSDEELTTIGRHARERAIPIRAYRYEKDKICPAKRLDTFEAAIPGLMRWELAGKQHATMTNALQTGAESAAALEDMIQYLGKRLK